MRAFNSDKASLVYREFGSRCAACGECLEATDWVRYVRDFVFHLHCFTCSVCGIKLSTGEEFIMRQSSLLCRAHGKLRTHTKAEDNDCGSGTCTCILYFIPSLPKIAIFSTIYFILSKIYTAYVGIKY